MSGSGFALGVLSLSFSCALELVPGSVMSLNCLLIEGSGREGSFGVLHGRVWNRAGACA